MSILFLVVGQMGFGAALRGVAGRICRYDEGENTEVGGGLAPRTTNDGFIPTA